MNKAPYEVRIYHRSHHLVADHPQEPVLKNACVVDQDVQSFETAKDLEIAVLYRGGVGSIGRQSDRSSVKLSLQFPAALIQQGTRAPMVQHNDGAVSREFPGRRPTDSPR